MSDIQEQLRKIEYVPPDAKDAPLGLYDKKELEALIQEQVISELENLPKDIHATHGSHTNICVPIQAVRARIKALKAGDE